MSDPWPDDRVATFKELYAAGLSHAQIGEAMGITRCASIGKAHRLGLDARKEAKPGPKSKRSPRNSFLRVRAPVIDHEPLSDLFEPLCERVLLLDLQPDECRWPVTEINNQHLFCAATKTLGSSYCAHHRRMSVNRSVRHDRGEVEIYFRQRRRDYRADAA